MAVPPADVVIVGAGPAGIAAVLALRGRRIAWIDPAFNAGRLERLQSVACNTKVDLLANEKIFRHPLLDPVKSAVEPEVKKMIDEAYDLPTLKDDPARIGWTTLGACKAFYSAATEALLPEEGITTIRGTVQSLQQDGNVWTAEVNHAGDLGTSEQITARCVVLATGVVPRPTPPFGGIENGHHEGRSLTGEDAFDVDALGQRLHRGARVAVLGNSHTAAIALGNIHKLVESLSLKVTLFARRPLRLAEWVPETGLYRYTSTGLKGFGAAFGREHMAGDSSWLELRPAAEFKLEDWDNVFDCTGYVPAPLPTLNGNSMLQMPPRDEPTGQLGDFAGLYAVGAPWGEPAGRFWGKGEEDSEGFKGEDSFIGFQLFFERALLIAKEIGALLK